MLFLAFPQLKPFFSQCFFSLFPVSPPVEVCLRLALHRRLPRQLAGTERGGERRTLCAAAALLLRHRDGSLRVEQGGIEGGLGWVGVEDLLISKGLLRIFLG